MATSSWLPGGVALGFLLLFGIRLWPGVFLGALAGALLAHDPFPASLLAAIGNTLSPLAGAYFLTRCTRFDPSLKHVRDIGLLVLYGGLAASLLSALVGAPAFLLGNHIPLPQFPHLLLDWWMSDFIGVVILTPLMLLIAAHPVNTCRMLQRPWEGMAIPLGAVTVIILSRLYSDLFFSPSISLLLLVPFFVWAAARLGQRGTAFTSFIIYMANILITQDTPGISPATIHHGWDIWLTGIVMTLCGQFIAVMFNERDEIAQQLRESEEHHRLSQLYGGIGAWESDLATQKQTWSENCSQILGFPLMENPTWDDFLKAVVPEDRHKVIEATRAHLEDNRPYEVSYRILDAQGKTRWMRSVGQAERNSDGVPIRMRGTVEDISTQVALFQSLQESEQRYRNLMDKARDAIVVTDMQGNIQQVNQAGLALLEYSQEEIGKLNVKDIHPKSELPKVRSHFTSVVAGYTATLETRLLSKSGKEIEIEVRPSLVEINGVKHPQGIFIDLTDRRRMEAERLEQEKAQREALIREVHHRIKNNLQGITGILRKFAEDHPQTAQPLTEAIGQVQSIALIHGIKMNLGTCPINLCSLIKPISQNNQILWKQPIFYHTPPCKTDQCEFVGTMGCHLMINEMETVPLALILNELITNAVKHGASSQSSPAQVEIALESTARGKTSVVHISNPGELGRSFDFEQRQGLGTGLHLVSTLMPSQGVKLSWRQHKHKVTASLELSSPVII